MWRAVVACMLVGCIATTWKPAGPDPNGRQVFVVTADRAVLIEDAEANAGRIGGHVLRMWQVPAGLEELLVTDTPSETARRAGWVELPPGGFFSAEQANVRAIRVTELTPGSKVAIGVVCVVTFLAGLAFLPLLGAANAN